MADLEKLARETESLLKQQIPEDLDAREQHLGKLLRMQGDLVELAPVDELKEIATELLAQYAVLARKHMAALRVIRELVNEGDSRDNDDEHSRTH